MNLEEYRAWIKKQGNKEETKAPEVAERVIRYVCYHYISTPFGEEPRIELYPRKFLKFDGKSYECDLVIEFSWRTFRTRKARSMRVGIEFKEDDFRKVVEQAIDRKPLFDLIFIATRPTTLYFSYEPYYLALLIRHGIGWVLWDEKLIYLLIPAKKRGWMNGKEMARDIEKLAEFSPRDPKTIMDYVGGVDG